MSYKGRSSNQYSTWNETDKQTGLTAWMWFLRWLESRWWWWCWKIALIAKRIVSPSIVKPWTRTHCLCRNITRKTGATGLIVTRISDTPAWCTGVSCGCGVGGKCQDSDNGRFEELHGRKTASMSKIVSTVLALYPSHCRRQIVIFLICISRKEVNSGKKFWRLLYGENAPLIYGTCFTCTLRLSRIWKAWMFALQLQEGPI